MRQDRQVGRSIHHTADQKVHMYGRLLASRAQYGPGNVHTARRIAYITYQNNIEIYGFTDD